MNSIYLIYGTDKILISKEIAKIISDTNVKKNSVIKFENEYEIDDIIEEASTISLFSSKKIIIIDYLEVSEKENVELLIDLLIKEIKDVYFIFYANIDKLDVKNKLYKIVSTTGKKIELKKDSNYIYKYVSDYLNDYQISNNDLSYFLSIVGTNIDNITNELDKLMTYKIKDKIITKEDITKLVNVNNEEEIFALTDAIIMNDVKKALELYHNFLNKNYEEIQMIAIIASQFRFMYQVKRLNNLNKSIEDIAKILEVKNPYRVKITISNCYSYSETDLLNYLSKLAEIDKNIKLGNVDKSYLELFLINKNM